MKNIKIGDVLIGMHPYLFIDEEGIVTEVDYETVVLGEPVKARNFELISKRDGEVLTNKDVQAANHVRVYDVYKKEHGLLLTKDIIDIRKKRGWSQEKMAKFLDIGLKDICRYENGAVQTKAIDNMIRLIDNDHIFYEMAKYLNKLSFAK